ncbi:MAG TPA: hypothetical protein VJP84_14510 [Steroidobacteraceae bacterium]|jgi:hypothetical protein|nr:hypothetical protein [Steroidobacteraceae bacterium]
MRIAWFVLTLALAAGAQAQSAGSKMTPELYRQMMDDFAYWDAQVPRYREVQKRAQELYPARRNTPLRDLNISDEEVREVEQLTRKYLPRAYVNISPVVTDCPCEEGPACTAQVYVVAQTPDETRGIQLSRMKDRWNVGVVQQWWTRRDAVVPQHTGNSMLDNYLYRKAVNELYEEFPKCAGPMQPAAKTASTPTPAEKK